MTEAEISAVIKRLKAYYPRYYRDITTADQAREVINVWKYQFGDVDKELVETAVDEWGGTQEYPPSIAEIKKTIGKQWTKFDRENTELERAMAEGKPVDKARLEKVKRMKDVAWKSMSMR